MESARWKLRTNSQVSHLDCDSLVLVLLSVTAVAVIATIPTNSKDVAKKYVKVSINEFSYLVKKRFEGWICIRIDEKKSGPGVLMTLKSEGRKSNWKIISSTELHEDLPITQLRRWRMGRRWFVQPVVYLMKICFADLWRRKWNLSHLKSTSCRVLSDYLFTLFIPNTAIPYKMGMAKRRYRWIWPLEPGEEDEEE